MSPILCMTRVRLTYPGPAGDVSVLDDVSLRVDSGECVALVGPSGSGKSSALQIAAGLQRPDAGTVTLAGRDLAGLADRDGARLRATRLGLVFQAFHLLPHLSALENVMVPAWLAGRPRRQAAADARKALASVGLETRSHHRPDQLSGGEQQRVGVARAVVNGPDLVLADEPTGNLDAGATDVVAGLLSDLARRGTAVLVATHDDRVAAVADRIVQLSGAQRQRQSVTKTSPSRTVTG